MKKNIIAPALLVGMLFANACATDASVEKSEPAPTISSFSFEYDDTSLLSSEDTFVAVNEDSEFNIESTVPISFSPSPEEPEPEIEIIEEADEPAEPQPEATFEAPQEPEPQPAPTQEQQAPEPPPEPEPEPTQEPQVEQNTGNNESSASPAARARSAADAAGCAGVTITFDDPRVVGLGYGAYDSTQSLILIDPARVNHRLEWVATHECMHHLQANVYGSWNATYNALGGVDRAERITDLMTILSGMNPAHAYYSTDGSEEEWEIARQILAGNKP